MRDQTRKPHAHQWRQALAGQAGGTRTAQAVRAGIAVCLALIALGFALVWPNRPLLATPVAQQPHTESPTASEPRVVERWRGTVYVETSTTDSYAGYCPWVCPGDDHELKQHTWDLEVYEDGYVRGYIKTNLLSFSYQQSKTNNSCGPVAETPYTINQCQFAGQIVQPKSEVFVEGRRELDQFTQEPVLKLTNAESLQECKSQWRARGIHSSTGAIVHKQEEARCSSGWYVPQSYRIEVSTDGQPPRIPMNRSSSFAGYRSTTWGELVGTPVKPFLELDRELLERSIFLDQVPVEALFTANLDWNSPDGGWVTWELSEEPPDRVGPTDESQLPKSLNPGEQGVGRKRLTAQAETPLKQVSPPETTEVTVAPPPAWAGAPSQISASKVSGAVVYKSSLKFPEPAFEGTVTVPSIVPWLGSKKLGIAETQGTLAWEAQSTSEGQGALAGQTGFEAMGGTVIGSLGGRAQVILGASGVQIPEGGMDFGIAGKIESDPEPLLKVVPSLNPALVAIEKISPQAAKFITERAQAKLELQPKLDFGFNFFSQDDEIKFKSAEAKPGFGFKTIVELKLIQDVLQATASIGGSILATFQVPEPYFKEAALQGLVQAQLTLYRWAWEGEKAWSVIIPGGAAAAGVGPEQLWESSHTSGSWQLLDRSYLDQPNYARWHGDAPQAQAQNEMALEDIRLVENVFPLANPSLDVYAGESGSWHMMQAWAHDEPTASATSAGEIAFTRNRGFSWRAPAFLTDDNRDDLAPKLDHVTRTDAMIIWQRMDVDNPPSFEDDPAGYLSHWQIAARSVADYDNDRPLQQISTSGSLNYRHQLGALSDGALAVWVNNPANQIFGDATNPDHVISARYHTNSRTWITNTRVLTGVAGLVSLDLATSGQTAALVYSRDLDGDLATNADQELFYVTWNGSSWSSATRLTNDNVADDSPQLVLDDSGTPLLVWRRNGVLRFLQGSWNGASVVLNLSGAAERTDYALVRSSDGELALVWQEVEPDRTGIGYAIYDATHNQWSSQRILMLPPEGDMMESENSTTPALAVSKDTFMATGITAGLLPADAGDLDDEVNGHLVLAYQLAHVESVTRTIDGATLPNVPQIGQHDLRVATLPLDVNLSVTPADLSLLSADTVQVVIRNTGDLAVANVPVALLIGPPNPETGQSTAMQQTVPQIAAHSAATLTFSIANRSATVYAVQIKPAPGVVESTFADNSAALGADVSITPLPTTYGAHGAVVRAQINQHSPRYISLVMTSTLSVDDPAGAVVGWSQMAFPLTPSTGITASAFISVAQLGAGRHHLFWTVDPGETLGEAERSNNVAGTMIMVLPDLAGLEDSIHFGTTPGNSAPFTMRVLNVGNWPNDGGVLTVFDGAPGEPGAHALLTLPLPDIEPGDEAVLTGDLQLAGLPAASTGLRGIYVQLDPEGVVDESNEHNNLLAAGIVVEVSGTSDEGFPLYLPLLEHNDP